jgi:transposase
VAVLEADLEREQDIEELRRIALAQHAQIQQLIRQLQKKCDTLSFYTGNKEELQQTLALIEGLNAQAAKLAAHAAKPKTDGAPAKPKKKPERTGPTEQPQLPHVPQRFELDTADRACPSCGGELFEMKGQVEASEMIDVVEVSYRVVQVEQQKYVCKCGGCVETAPGPERAAPGSRYSLALAIKVVLDKYLDHIPLERQVRIMGRHHLIVTSQTLWDLANAVARRLERIDAALVQHVLAQPVIGLDQTGWPRLDGSGTKPWQMWCLTAPGVVVHRIRDDKSAATFKDLVGTYKGTIVCDALKTHEAGARDGPGIVLAACWAHVYRKFEEAMPDHPEAEKALRWIGALYDIDERAAGDRERLAELRRTGTTAPGLARERHTPEATLDARESGRRPPGLGRLATTAAFEEAGGGEGECSRPCCGGTRGLPWRATASARRRTSIRMKTGPGAGGARQLAGGGEEMIGAGLKRASQ